MSHTTKLSCRRVWKLYGPDAVGVLQNSNNTLTGEAIQSAGLIGAVRDANIDIREGEIFVVMGLSGSGKSTLVRCLSRLVEPTAGEIMFEGQDLLAASRQDMIEIRRHRMGMVFQHFALLPHLSVLQNVAFPLDIQGVRRDERERRAQEMITLVGLEGREDYFPRELSGGQQQRVGIARSLAVEPSVWFLDEPFSALDPLIRREMQDEFLRLQEKLHKTIVFITHDFDEAIRLADRIAIMQGGEIIQVATPEELILNPATDYVAEFTKHVPRAKVLTARALMKPVSDGANASVPAGAKVEDIAEQVIAGTGATGVVDGDGIAIGAIYRQDVIDVLVGREIGK